MRLFRKRQLVIFFILISDAFPAYQWHNILFNHYYEVPQGSILMPYDICIYTCIYRLYICIHISACISLHKPKICIYKMLIWKTQFGLNYKSGTPIYISSYQSTRNTHYLLTIWITIWTHGTAWRLKSKYVQIFVILYFVILYFKKFLIALNDICMTFMKIYFKR